MKDHVTKYMVDTIASNTLLRMISFLENNTGGEGVKSLSKLFRQNSGLNVLWLCQNKSENDGIKDLSEVLKTAVLFFTFVMTVGIRC